MRSPPAGAGSEGSPWADSSKAGPMRPGFTLVPIGGSLRGVPDAPEAAGVADAVGGGRFSPGRAASGAVVVPRAAAGDAPFAFLRAWRILEGSAFVVVILPEPV